LSDWDWSGRIWVFADKSLRSRYSTEAAAMWDENNLYLAAKWRDPTPMYSQVNPEFNPSDGWKSDSWQMRVKTDRTLWITTWFYTPKKQPVMHFAYWQNERNARAGQDVTMLTADPGGTDLGRGAKMAYRKNEKEDGYVQEMKIPWDLLFKKVPNIKPGLAFKLGCEFLWGDPTGKTWPIHRYADNMQPDMTSREFYWSNRKAWGNIRLIKENNIELRQYVGGKAKLTGAIPIRLELPADAARFSLVIEDQKGNRIRNIGGLDPVDYTVEDRGDKRLVEVPWDGLTESRWITKGRKTLDVPGKLVSPGKYNVRGLYHEGLGARYEMCFYNPGKPPWHTRDGTGAWGANHVAPKNVAAAGDQIAISWPFSEGGHSTIVLGPDGLKRWGELRGGDHLAADENYVYTIPGHRRPPVLNRFSAKDGSYQPFKLDGEERDFDLRLETLFGGEAPGDPVGLAAAGNRVALAMSGKEGEQGQIALLKSKSAELIRTLQTASPKALAMRSAGGKLELYAVAGSKIHRVDPATGKHHALTTPGLDAPSALDIDADGNLVVADVGTDSQVKAFSPDGKLVYTCGKKGGRPIRGRFDPQAMMKMSSVAVDSKGQIWVVENWNYPRRVSVWGKDGKLIRDYIGNTGYAGTGCFLHDQDPSLAYSGPIEMKLNRGKRSWKVTRILWVPDPDVPGETFRIPTSGHKHPQRFRSDASGEMHEYLYVHDPRDQGGQVVYMETDDGWQPVAAICLVGHISGRIDRRNVIREMPKGDFKDLNPHDGVFWNDDNGDGRVQREECKIIPTDKPGKLDDRRHRGQAALSLRNGWGGRIDTRTFNIYTDGLVRYSPAGFRKNGAPIYKPEGMKNLEIEERGDLVPVSEENRLLCLSWKGYAGPTSGMLGIDLERGKIDWTYPNPYPGVHGSHRAPMPWPGLLIGPLKILGVVHVNDEVGRVFAMRGNLGKDYFMTTDGLYVGSMFRDCRLPSHSLPAKEEQLIGMPMGTFSEGGEPFSGWFGKQDDGTIRMTTSMARTAAMIIQISGLETIKRIPPRTLGLSTAELAKAERFNALKQAKEKEPRRYRVAKMKSKPNIDGRHGDWKAIPDMQIQRNGSPRNATARLA
ncbi:MAG: hypothetical protein KGZ25_12940, partial [Planctomycetes bacterium]|nr:hypothetical protein [Planctomycetota bacterium]